MVFYIWMSKFLESFEVCLIWVYFDMVLYNVSLKTFAFCFFFRISLTLSLLWNGYPLFR